MKGIGRITLFLFGVFLFTQAATAEGLKDSKDLTKEVAVIQDKGAEKPFVDFFSGTYVSTPGKGHHPKRSHRLRAGEDLHIGFRILDPLSGERLGGKKALAWLTPRKAGDPAPDQEACENKIKRLLKGGIEEGGMSLNSFYIVTLNGDDTITIINPMVNVASTNILAVIGLKGRAGGWDLDQRLGLLYITVPDQNEVVVIDMHTLAIKSYIKVGKEPRAIHIHSNDATLWVGNEGEGSISVINGQGGKVLKTIPVGKGGIDLLFDKKGQYAFVATEGDGLVSIIDAKAHKKIREIQAGKGEISLAYASQNKVLYISMAQSREIAMLSTADWRVIKRIPVSMGVEYLQITPDGKTLFALNREKRKVILIDTVGNEVFKILPTKGSPDHMLFTDAFAYIRNQENIDMTLIPLAQLRHPESLAPAAIPVGVSPPNKKGSLMDFSPMAIMPDRTGALIVNPADEAIFFYMEGMNAPMKSFKTFTATPQGLLVYDRSLKDHRFAGTYQTVVKLKNGGTYDVPFFLDKPRVVTCFEMKVAADPSRPEKRLPPIFDSHFGDTVYHPGETSRIVFQLRDAKTGEAIQGLKHIRLLSFFPGFNWQVRVSAREVEAGVYEADFTFPREGNYPILVQIPSLGIGFRDIRSMYAKVEMEKVTMKEK